MKNMLSTALTIFSIGSLLLFTACNGNSGTTGGAQADSGQTNVGSSGPADSAQVSAGSGSPQPIGTGGTDTSTNGKGTTNPTTDSTKTNPR